MLELFFRLPWEAHDYVSRDGSVGEQLVRNESGQNEKGFIYFKHPLASPPPWLLRMLSDEGTEDTAVAITVQWLTRRVLKLHR